MSPVAAETMFDLPERFAVMVQQESTSYQCEDYLSPTFQRKRQLGGVTSALPAPDGEETATVEWRSKICDWSYQVMDHFDYDREIVAISLSYLDRYLSKTSKHINKPTFQLVAMTTLYMACKLHDPRMLRISSVIGLSRGYFTEDDIVATEKSILDKLSWLVHPPTPVTFLRHFILLLPPNSMPPAVWCDTMEVAKFLTELSVADYFFIAHQPSSIGIAALLTAMEETDARDLFAQSKQTLHENVLRVTGVDSSSEEVMDCRERLRIIYHEGNVYERQQKEAGAAAKTASLHKNQHRATGFALGQVSPRSASAMPVESNV